MQSTVTERQVILFTQKVVSVIEITSAINLITKNNYPAGCQASEVFALLTSFTPTRGM